MDPFVMPPIRVLMCNKVEKFARYFSNFDKNLNSIRQAKMAAFCWILLDIIFALKPLYASGMYSFYKAVQKVIGIK